MTNHTPSAKFVQLRAFIDVTPFSSNIGNMLTWAGTRCQLRLAPLW